MIERFIYQPSYVWRVVGMPYDARRTDRLFRVFIKDDSLKEIKIYKHDVAIANLARQPAQGQFSSLIKT